MMNKICLLILFLVANSITALSGHKDYQKILTAQQLCRNKFLHEADTIISQIDTTGFSHKEYQQYYLMLIEKEIFEDKYMDEDTLVLIVESKYMPDRESTDYSRLMIGKAFYYADAGIYEEASKCMMEALAVAEKNKNYLILGDCYKYMGSIEILQNDETELDYLDSMSYVNYCLANDTSSIIRALINLSQKHNITYEQSDSILDIALDLSEKSHLSNRYFETVFAKAGLLYLMNGECEESFHQFMKLPKQIPDSYRIPVHSILGKIYECREEYAKAIEEQKYVLSLNPNEKIRIASYQSLRRLYYYMNEIDSCNAYADKCENLQSTFYQRNKQHSAIIARRAYANELLRNERERLKSRIVLLSIIVALIIIASVLIYFLIRHRHKAERIEAQLRILDLLHELDTTNSEFEEVQKQNEDIQVIAKELLSHKAGQMRLDDKNWQQIRKDVDIIYKGFSRKISSVKGLTDKHVTQCIMMRAGMSIKEIAWAMDCTDKRAYNRKYECVKLIQEHLNCSETESIEELFEKLIA